MQLLCHFQKRSHLCSTTLVVVLLSILSLLSVPAFGAGSAPKVEDIQIIQLIQKFLAARSQFDVDTLRQITADQYVEVFPDGGYLSRKDMLAAYGPEHRGPAPENESSEWNVRLVGDTGVVVSHLTYDLKAAGSDTRHIDLRVIYVVQRYNGGWRLLSAQFTPIAAPSNQQ
jgi:ketosteroid isomerase-like protein